MMKFLRKRSHLDSPKSPKEPPPAVHAPLYARFASTQSAPQPSTPAISGPAPLSSRTETPFKPGNNEFVAEKRKNKYAFKGRSTDKPLPTPNLITDDIPSVPPKSVADAVPRQHLSPADSQRMDINTKADQEQLRNSHAASDSSPTLAATIARLGKIDLLFLNEDTEDRSFPISASFSSAGPVLRSVSQKHEPVSGADIPTPTADPEHVAPRESPIARKRIAPTAALGLEPSPQPEHVSDNNPNLSQTGSTPLTIPQPDSMKNQDLVHSSHRLALRQSPTAPSHYVPPQSPEHPSVVHRKNPPSAIVFPNRHLDAANLNVSRSKSRRESLPAAINGAPEPRVRRHSSTRSRTAPFGPRASLNQGPSNLVQGQPRIFASMANPDSQDLPVPKPGQPRIFAIANPDSSPPMSPLTRQPDSFKPTPEARFSPTRDQRYPTEAAYNQSTKSYNHAASHRPSPSKSSQHNSSSTNDWNAHSRNLRQLHAGHVSTKDEKGSHRLPEIQREGKIVEVPGNSFSAQPQHQFNYAIGDKIVDLRSRVDTNGEALQGTQNHLVQRQSNSVADAQSHRGEKVSSSQVIQKEHNPEVLQRPPLQPSRSTDSSRNMQGNIFKEMPDIPDAGSSRGSYSAKPEVLDAPLTDRLPESDSRIEISESTRYMLDQFHNNERMTTSNLMDNTKPILSSSAQNILSADTMMGSTETKLNLAASTEPTGGSSSQNYTLKVRYYPLERHISDPQLLGYLLQYLTFYDWCVLYSINKKLRIRLMHANELKEEVLESYLKTIGYLRWIGDEPEPISLTLRDLSEYMRGVSIPTHQYSRISEAYLHALYSNAQDKSLLADQARSLSFSSRAYSRVVIRLRLQAEAIARHGRTVVNSPPGAMANKSRVQHQVNGNVSRPSSRAPSPSSTVSHGQQRLPSVNGHANATLKTFASRTTFTSPIYTPRRAPLLRVFVPSPEGECLSDASVVECEAELGRAGIAHLLRPGDTVWDIAVGDEGNAGRMVWDGSYLLDLDYTYSTSGDLPRYMPTLAFSPSYFHRVIRITGNPIAYIDLGPWAEEIAMNLQLLQDRVKTETPQGNYHTVVRWVHRSSFEIQPPPGGKRIPVVFGSGNWTVDRGWYGTVVVEAEGTNEGLADLQSRCRSAFPPRVSGQSSKEEERRRVFRILRERSKPGEIWIRTVNDKERLLP